MNVLVFLNALGLGGTEKAACRWAMGLHHSGRKVAVLSLQDGLRRKSLEEAGIEVRIVEPQTHLIKDQLVSLQPDVIHAHCPGYPHEGDILGAALQGLGKKIPVVQTNIFGKLKNPRENAWTDFRLFISWTSCVQAARRSHLPLDEAFFRDKSVAVYPVDPVSPEKLDQLRVAGCQLREQWGVREDEILFGRFSRPEPNKWTDLPLQAFLEALKANPKIKLLLREPPPKVARWIRESRFGSQGNILVLPATADVEKLQASQMACDAILHGSSIGESFGYGIAEPMALGKPVIANSVPWNDQAQIELIRHGEGGLVASTIPTVRDAILHLAKDRNWAHACGSRAQKQILEIADPQQSLQQVMKAFCCASEGRPNPDAGEDSRKAVAIGVYLERHQWGSSWRERFHLRLRLAVIRTLRTLKAFRTSHPLLCFFFDSTPIF